MKIAAPPCNVVVPLTRRRYELAPVSVSVALPMARLPIWIALPVGTVPLPPLLVLEMPTLTVALLLTTKFNPLVVPPNRVTVPGVEYCAPGVPKGMGRFVVGSTGPPPRPNGFCTVNAPA